MEPKRPISRRSFMQRVGGGVVVAGSATMLTGCVGLVDADPYDPIGGRGYGRPYPPRGGYGGYGGCSDNDYGQYADPAGRGRRCAAPAQGCSDSDTGRNADPAGRGRRCGGRPQGCTDADRGRNQDPAGQGRCRR